jgi:glycosyltransferase involved in cell wall biosynthesis
MRVVHVIDSGGYYGAEVMLLNLCVEQKKQSLDVEVISIGNTNQDAKPIEIQLAAAGVKVNPWRMRAIPDPRQSLKILTYCQITHTNVIHSHGYKGNILLGLVPLRLRKIPIVTTVHGYTRARGFNKLAVYQWLDRMCLTRLDAVVIVSASMTHQIPAKRLGKKLHTIPNGIPHAPETTAKETYSSAFLTHEFKMGALGRLSYEKNFSLLINAMPQIVKAIPRARLVIYGEGDQRPILESLIRELQLEEKVTLPGYLHNTQAFFEDIDVFVNSSITEGMPISLLEAMRQNTPIVATEIAANVALLGNLNNGNSLCQLNELSLASTVVNLHNATQADKESWKNTNKLEFLEKYTLEKMGSTYKNLYQALIENY